MSHPRVVRRSLATASTLGVLVTLGAAAAPSASASVASTSWGSTATLATSIQGATLTGNAPASAPVRLAVTLKPQNAVAEQAALRAMYQPGSATFHQFLTPAQWEAAYAPTSAQVSAVTSYLSNNGFTGVSVQGDRLLISAAGTVGDAEQAFNTTIGNYKLPNGSTFRANISGAQVPSSLAGIVQAVVGLSNWRLPTPQPVLMTQSAASRSAAKTAARRVAAARHAGTNGTPAGNPVIPNEIPPEDFQNTYDATGTPTGARTAVALFTQGAVMGGRAVPDIAMDADPNVATAAEIYVNGTPTGVGGTSLSSPLALGSWARLQSGHGNKLGMAAIDFYALYDKVNPSLGDTSPVPGFTDIVGGNNGGYTATPGYDEVTGIGALDIAALNPVIAGS